MVRLTVGAYPPLADILIIGILILTIEVLLELFELFEVRSGVELGGTLFI